MLNDAIINAHKKLTLKEALDTETESSSTLSKSVLGLYNARQKASQVKKVEKHYKEAVMGFIKVGDTLALADIGLEVKLTTKSTIDMDEAQLEYVLTELIKEKPELANVMTKKRKLITTVHSDILQQYIADGSIDEAIILPCITNKEALTLKVKKIKGGKLDGKS